MTRAGRRAGTILFEILLSIALFVGAAAFALSTTSTVLVVLDRSARDALALDLARATLAELEAGLVTVAALRDAEAGIDRIGSFDPLDEDAAADRAGVRWLLRVTTEPTEYTGLTLVEVTVEEQDDASGESRRLARATLRQLVALRDIDAEPYEQDDLLDGMPRTAEDAR